MRLRPLGDSFAAEVLDLDLATLDDDRVAALHAALARHGVLLLRRQALSDDDLVSLMEKLGEPDRGVNRNAVSQSDDRLIFVSNLRDARRRSLGGQEDRAVPWHNDNYFRARPSVSVLYALLLPPEGGDTAWCSTRLGWQALPQALAERVEPLVGLYEIPKTARWLFRDRHARQPLVWRSPATGRRSLYVSSKVFRVEGLSARASKALVAELLSHVLREAHVYRHRWGRGDLFLYDNGQTLHARKPFRGPRFLKAGRVLVAPDLYPAPPAGWETAR